MDFNVKWLRSNIGVMRSLKLLKLPTYTTLYKNDSLYFIYLLSLPSALVLFNQYCMVLRVQTRSRLLN